MSRIECIKQKKELEAKNFEIIQVRVKQRKKIKVKKAYVIYRVTSSNLFELLASQREERQKAYLKKQWLRTYQI